MKKNVLTNRKKQYKMLGMKKLRLNTKKIKFELDRLGKNQTWLASQLNFSRQRLSYLLRSNSIKAAEKIGHVLGIEPKDLII